MLAFPPGFGIPGKAIDTTLHSLKVRDLNETPKPSTYKI